jgi:hypothetical protein
MKNSNNLFNKLLIISILFILVVSAIAITVLANPAYVGIASQLVWSG